MAHTTGCLEESWHFNESITEWLGMPDMFLCKIRKYDYVQILFKMASLGVCQDDWGRWWMVLPNVREPKYLSMCEPKNKELYYRIFY